MTATSSDPDQNNELSDSECAHSACKMSISELVQDRIQQSIQLIDLCKGHQLKSIPGSSKLANRIKSEKMFLEGVLADPNKMNNPKLVRTSNLSHLRALVTAACDDQSAMAILHVGHGGLPYPNATNGNQKHKLHIDLLVDGGSKWVKVIARSARSVYMDWVGANSRSGRSLDEQAKEYIATAAANPHHFVPPVVEFRFTKQVPDRIADQLADIGVTVIGQRVPVGEFGTALDSSSSEDASGSDDSDSQEDSDVSDTNNNETSQQPVNSLANHVTPTSQRTIKPTNGNSDQIETVSADQETLEKEESNVVKSIGTLSIDNSRPSIDSGLPLLDWVNLDVTALIVFVSNVTHGHANYTFTEKGLDDQALLERQTPALPHVLHVTKDKRLMCCRTAFESFQNIIRTVAGKAERDRAGTLLPQVCVVEDRVSPRVAALRTSDRVSARAQAVFGTGDSYRAITLSANRHFVQSAAQQGVVLVASIHESRALTEDKQAHAKPILID